MEEDKYWLLMSRYLTNEITLEETDELLMWIDEDPKRIELLQQLQDDWGKSDVYGEAEEAFDTHVAWQKVSARIDQAIEKPKSKVRYLYWAKIAALFLIVFNFGWFGFRYYNNHQVVEIKNQLAIAKEVVLPDGSQVWLNSGSKLSYQKGFVYFDERAVNLDGEAFFEVKPNPEKPFIIETQGTETRVLGTSFNVKSFEGEVAVSVFTGKVSFKALKTSSELLLLPGEEGVFSKNQGLRKIYYEDQNFMFWKDQKLDFSNERLEDVLSVIASVYGVTFEVLNPELKRKQLTTSFHKLPFVEVKTILEMILDTEIEKAGDVYVVK